MWSGLKYIFDIEEKKYFAGWQSVSPPDLWSPDPNEADFYTSIDEADDDYETLKGAGRPVEVMG